MKLWISGEIDSDIAASLREARNAIEEAVNNIFTSNDYGDGIVSWDVIMMVSNEGNEAFKYNRKKKETDVRVLLSKSRFQPMDLLKWKLMILSALIRAVDELSTLEIDNFNGALLKQDLLNLEEKITTNAK